MTESESETTLELVRCPGRFAVCRLEPGTELPEWFSDPPRRTDPDAAPTRPLRALLESRDELSLVCEERSVPATVRAERGFAALRVRGTLDFALVGILSALLSPLAAAGISVFVLSSYDTDYLLVREEQLARAVETLRTAGHRIASS